MRRCCFVIGGVLVLNALGTAQVIDNLNTSQDSYVLDQDYSYDEGYINPVYFLYQDAGHDDPLNVTSSDISQPYSVAAGNGTVSGYGDGASVSSTFDGTNLTGFFSDNANLSANLTGSGAAYGVYGESRALTYITFAFTAAEAGAMSYGWQMSANSPESSASARIWDIEANTSATLFNLSNGSSAGGGNYALTANEDYVMIISVEADPNFNFVGSSGAAASGFASANGFFTAAFAAPEPITFSLLGFGAAALLRRRRSG